MKKNWKIEKMHIQKKIKNIKKILNKCGEKNDKNDRWSARFFCFFFFFVCVWPEKKNGKIWVIF